MPDSEGAPDKIRIVLADDHKLVRDGLRFYLSRLAEETEVLEAETFAEALSLASEAPSLDLIILDLKMPGMNGFAGLEIMRTKFPDLPVVILSGVTDRETVLTALERGAAGFLPKTMSGKALIGALRLVFSGEKYIPSIVLPQSGQVQEGGPLASAQAFASGSPLTALTRREREVLSHLVHGKPNKEIARELKLQEVTIKLHLKGIFRKLGASNRTQAVRIAMELGWDG